MAHFLPSARLSQEGSTVSTEDLGPTQYVSLISVSVVQITGYTWSFVRIMLNITNILLFANYWLFQRLAITVRGNETLKHIL